MVRDIIGDIIRRVALKYTTHTCPKCGHTFHEPVQPKLMIEEFSE